MKCRAHVIGLALLAVLAAGQQINHSDTFHYDPHAWQELRWRQSLRRLNLAPALKADLIETIIEQMREDGFEEDSETGHLSKEQLRDIAAETRVAFVDLAGHGNNEVIAQAGGEKSGCSPTGNCPFWVLRRQRDGYHVILDAESAQTFTIQPHRTHGLRDLVLSMHGSATDSTLTLYKFNGSSYGDVACYDENWETADENGDFHHLKEPRITACR
jgi:hypothetical protein